jgi:hypothetical protein
MRNKKNVDVRHKGGHDALSERVSTGQPWSKSDHDVKFRSASSEPPDSRAVQRNASSPRRARSGAVAPFGARQKIRYSRMMTITGTPISHINNAGLRCLLGRWVNVFSATA